MTKTMQDYFQSEMHLLQEYGQYFAQQYPEQASMIGFDRYGSQDPHMARLLEGVAYLNARTKQQIDLGVHHVSEMLLRHLAPTYLMPRPSMAIIEFKSRQNRLIRSENIPMDVQLSSNALGDEQTSCFFTTRQALTLHPILLDTIHMEDKQRLCLRFHVNQGVDLSHFQLNELSLFIHTETKIAAKWYWYLTKKCTSIYLKQGIREPQYFGGQSDLVGNHLNEFPSLMPNKLFPTDAYELFLDYFQFPERFQFVTLKLPPNIIQTQSFDIGIEFDEVLPDLCVFPDLFKLHCVPASNLYTLQSEPIRYHKNRSEYPLVISKKQPQSQQLLAIKKVEAYSKRHHQRIEIQNFHEHEQVEAIGGTYRLVYHYGEQPVSNHRLIFAGQLPDELLISCDVWAFNGDYPRSHLKNHGLYLVDGYLSSDIEATNITKPSRCGHRIFNNEHSLHMLNALNTRFESLADITFFKKLLTFHDRMGVAKELIAAITQINLHPFTQIQKGTFTQGIIFKLIMHESLHCPIEKCYFFGQILHAFLGYFAPINQEIELNIMVMPSEKQLQWKRA